MFDKVSQVAEKLATNVSRRAFLGRLGQGALVLAGAMAAMLAFPRLGQAAKDNAYCCYYGCANGTVLKTRSESGAKCHDTYQGCPFVSFGPCGL